MNNFLYGFNIFLTVLWGTMMVAFDMYGLIVAFLISLVTVVILTVLRKTNACDGAWR